MITASTALCLLLALPQAESQPASKPAPATPQPPPPPAADEIPVLQELGKKLNAFATLAFRANYPRRARDIWLEVLSEYDANDEVARKALGFRQVGATWSLDPSFEYPEQDKPDAAVAYQLSKKWQALCEELGKTHRDYADKLKAGSEGRSRYHRERALRFLPNDAKIAAAQGLKSFEGFFGTDVDIAVLRRSRLMAREIQTQLNKTYAVQPLPAGTQHALLSKGGVNYKGFKSDHFTIWGDWEDEVLTDAARNAERSLAFCRVAFAGYDGFPGVKTKENHFGFFKEKATWARIVTANRGGASNADLEFILQNTSATGLGSGATFIRVAGVEQEPNVNDLSVRWVVQHYTGFQADALQEGIGHAIVGMFFGRNLIYLVAQEKQKGTVAGGRKEKALLPDMTSWAEAAAETAWSKTAVPAADLPLIKASKFTEEARIKSWSFCDYLLRRDPLLLLHLEKAVGSGARNPPQVREKFRTLSQGVDLDYLDDCWRRFWTEDTPLLRAVKSKVTPLESVSKAAPEWLGEFNKLRTGLPLTDRLLEVGWSESYSAECKAHVEYLKSNASERGPGNEHTQKPNLKAATNAGRAFAQMAIVSTGQADAKKAVANWLDLPGYRDAVLDRGLETVGLYADGGLMVMDVTRGVVRGTPVTMHYPFVSQQGIPNEVEVKALGPDVEGLLRNKKLAVKTLGYPITLHFFRGVPRDTNAIECKLMQGKDDVPGILHRAFDGTNRCSSAPGLFVFYPLLPLKRGVEYHVTWSGTGTPIDFKFMTK
jgi:hypothetical protein